MTESVKSFTSKKPPVAFNIDGDTFLAYSVLPADTYGEFAEKVLLLQRSGAEYAGADKVALDVQQSIKTVLDAVELCLDADSVERLVPRLKDKDNPLTAETMTEVLLWLLDHLGISGDKDADKEATDGSRPTQPTSDSPGGSPTTGDGSPEKSPSVEAPTP